MCGFPVSFPYKWVAALIFKKSVSNVAKHEDAAFRFGSSGAGWRHVSSFRLVWVFHMLMLF